MNTEAVNLIAKIIPESYANQGADSRRSHQKLIRQLIEQHKLPENGWPEITIESLLSEISLMDSNNFIDRCGIGEREGRVVNSLVNKRHFHLSHGIGRSGDIAENQPKAAGSSLLSQLSNSLVLDLIQTLGLRTTKCAIIIPCATGMTLMLSMLALKPKRPSANYIIFPRIDQKSCLKSIISGGFTPIIIEPLISGDELTTNLHEIDKQINKLGAENCLCILSTTSCFAPRISDDLIEVSKICSKFSIPHIVNNAYGLQCTKCIHLIEQATRIGRVDVFVQSTDKNLMVPVGGSIVAGFDRCFIQSIGSIYPGRGSATPSIDVFITLLSLGKNGYKKLLEERKQIFAYMNEQLDKLSIKFGERLLNIGHNGISMAMSLQTFNKNTTEIGSMLYKRFVCGARVIEHNNKKTVCGIDYTGWGSHCDNYPCSYITAAAAIGIKKQDVDLFILRLTKVLNKMRDKIENGNNKT